MKLKLPPPDTRAFPTKIRIGQMEFITAHSPDSSGLGGKKMIERFERGLEQGVFSELPNSENE